MRDCSVFILGMHRSGTSCLAGSLEAAGLQLGDVVEWAPRNLKGNRESIEIRKLNNRVLEDSGGSWFNPPARVTWSAPHKRTRDRLVAQFQGTGKWGFKDPRTLLTLEGWLEALPDAQFVGTFRHPTAVIQSLEFASDRLSFDGREQLWIAYNKRLMSAFRERPFPILCFDWDNTRYNAAVIKIVQKLGLNQRPDFFDPALRTNQSRPDMTISSKAMELYEALLDVADSEAGIR